MVRGRQGKLQGQRVRPRLRQLREHSRSGTKEHILREGGLQGEPRGVIRVVHLHLHVLVQSTDCARVTGLAECT